MANASDVRQQKEVAKICKDLERLEDTIGKLSEGFRRKVGAKKATGAEQQISVVLDGVNDRVSVLREKYENRIADPDLAF